MVFMNVRSDELLDNGSHEAELQGLGRGGPDPGAQVHVPLPPDQQNQSAVRLTEGELKADVATALSGIRSASVPGVSSWRKAVPQELGSGKVHLAFDADANKNANVARVLFEVPRKEEQKPAAQA